MTRRTAGEGTIRQRTRYLADGTSSIRYSAVVSVPTLGGRRRVEGPERDSREAARRDLTRLTAQRDAAMIPTGSTGVAAYLRGWLDRRRGQVRERTLATYRNDLERHVIPRLGHLRLDALTPSHVAALVLDLRRANGDAVARKARAALHAALADAVRLEVVGRNACAAVPAPPAPAHVGAGWTPADARAFLAACATARHGRLYTLVLATGLRAGEVLGLRWEDVAPDALLVRQAIRTVGTPIVVPPKTARSRRTVPIPADVYALLLDQEAAVAADRDRARRLGLPWEDHGLVFPARNGRPLRLENVRRDYLKAQERAGVPHARLHDLRHYHLTRLVALGVDVDTVSRRAGHSRTSTTLDLYVHGDDDAQRGGAISLAALTGIPTSVPTAGPGSSGSERDE